MKAWQKNLPDRIITVDMNEGTLRNLKQSFPLIETKTAIDKSVTTVDVTALHPPAVTEAITAIAPIIGETSAIISLAPKITTAMGSIDLWFQLAESFGLSPDEATRGVLSMTTGAVKTLYESGLSPAGVMDLVPVKQMAEHEETIRGMYTASLPVCVGNSHPDFFQVTCIRIRA